MKRGELLNADLSAAIAQMGHGDLMIVCDAGFPIPEDAWRIDLAIKQDLPDLQTILSLINGAFITEKVSYADALPDYNPVLLNFVKDLFDEADHEMISHEVILSEMAVRAKVIVRTGAYDPWGNILCIQVSMPKWFSKPGVVAPPEYAKKLK